MCQHVLHDRYKPGLCTRYDLGRVGLTTRPTHQTLLTAMLASCVDLKFHPPGRTSTVWTGPTSEQQGIPSYPQQYMMCMRLDSSTIHLALLTQTWHYPKIADLHLASCRAGHCKSHLPYCRAMGKGFATGCSFASVRPWPFKSLFRLRPKSCKYE